MQLMEERSQEASAREKLSLEKDVLSKEKQDMLLNLQQQEDKEMELLQQVNNIFEILRILMLASRYSSQNPDE